MSKASEYAEIVKYRQILIQRSRADIPKFGDIAVINNDGSLMTHMRIVKPDEALKLADWIYEYYREENQEK
jgi:hypothetical protein